MNATATYRKTRQGEWVVFGPAAVIAECAHRGDRIEVTKRDGTTKLEAIERCGKAFTADGRQMAYGYIARTARPSASRSSRREMCDECGDRPAVTTAYDLSGIPGRVCGGCKRNEGSLSFA
jgi:hypothetical protein